MINFSAENIKAIQEATGCSMQDAKALLLNHETHIPLRDYFAAKAMQVQIINLGNEIVARQITKSQIKEVEGMIPDVAYAYADAMLKAREKRKK